MEKQNITLSLPKVLLKKVKSFAAMKESSISDIVRKTLEEKIDRETGYENAKKRQISSMKKGFDLGTEGDIAISREKLYERR